MYIMITDQCDVWLYTKCSASKLRASGMHRHCVVLSHCLRLCIYMQSCILTSNNCFDSQLKMSGIDQDHIIHLDVVFTCACGWRLCIYLSPVYTWAEITSLLGHGTAACGAHMLVLFSQNRVCHISCCHCQNWTPRMLFNRNNWVMAHRKLGSAHTPICCRASFAWQQVGSRARAGYWWGVGTVGGLHGEGEEECHT